MKSAIVEAASALDHDDQGGSLSPPQQDAPNDTKTDSASLQQDAPNDTKNGSASLQQDAPNDTKIQPTQQEKTILSTILSKCSSSVPIISLRDQSYLFRVFQKRSRGLGNSVFCTERPEHQSTRFFSEQGKSEEVGGSSRGAPCGSV